MKYLQTIFIALLSSLLICIPCTSCTVSQSKINTVVQNIASTSETVVSSAQAFQTVLATFSPADATVIQPLVTQIQNDGTLINTLSNQYLSNPSSDLLTQISSA